MGGAGAWLEDGCGSACWSRLLGQEVAGENRWPDQGLAPGQPGSPQDVGGELDRALAQTALDENHQSDGDADEVQSGEDGLLGERDDDQQHEDRRQGTNHRTSEKSHVGLLP